MHHGPTYIYIYIYRKSIFSSYKISYFTATPIYDNFIYYFTIISIHIYDSWVTITHGDIYHNVIVNHFVREYYNEIKCNGEYINVLLR